MDVAGLQQSVSFGWTTIRESRWGHLTQHHQRRVVIFERSMTPCHTPDDAQALVESLLGAMRGEHHDCGLVIDMRLARGNNRDFFEGIFVEALENLSQAFARVVFVVSTMSGMLQIVRMQRNRNANEDCVSHDPTRAIAFAAGEAPLG